MGQAHKSTGKHNTTSEVLGEEVQGAEDTVGGQENLS